MTYYLDYVNGSDSNDGLSAANPWKNISKANDVAVAGDTLVINTVDGPMYMDEPLTLAFEITGIGDLSIPLYPSLGSELADLRPWKLITSGSFAQPNAGTYPNVWSTTDTEAEAFIFEEIAWATDTSGGTPIKAYTKVDGANYAAVVATINSTAGSFWTDGTTMYFHPIGSTNPNSDSKQYARTRPTTHATALLFKGSLCKDIAIGGVMGASTTGTATSGAALWHDPQPGEDSELRRCYAYGGNNHTIRCNPQTTGVINSVIWTDVFWDQCSPSGSWTNHVDYTGAGVTITLRRMRRCGTTKAKLAGGSAVGAVDASHETVFMHGVGTITTLEWLDCSFNGGTVSAPSETILTNPADIRGTTFPAYATTLGFDYVMDRCHFTGPPPRQYSTTARTQTVRNSLFDGAFYTHTSYAQLVGTVVWEYNTFDARNTLSGASGGWWMKRAGTLNFTSRGNLVIATNPLGQPIKLGQVNTATDTLVSDYNAVVGIYNDRSYFTLDSTDKTIAAMKVAGYDAHSTNYNPASQPSTSAIDALVESDYRPKVAGGLVNAGVNVGPAMDYTGATFATRNDIGSIEYDAAAPTITAAAVDSEGLNLVLTVSKYCKPLTAMSGFTLSSNDRGITLGTGSYDEDTLTITIPLSSRIYTGETGYTVNYTPGNVTSFASVALVAFSDLAITNGSTVAGGAIGSGDDTGAWITLETIAAGASVAEYALKLRLSNVVGTLLVRYTEMGIAREEELFPDATGVVAFDWTNPISPGEASVVLAIKSTGNPSLTGAWKLADTTGLTITGTVPAAAPAGQSTGYLTMYDAGGDALADATLEYRLVSTDSSAAGRSFPRAIETTDVSGADGALEVTLLADAVYEFRRDGGAWITVNTNGSGTVTQLPEVLGLKRSQ